MEAMSDKVKFTVAVVTVDAPKSTAVTKVKEVTGLPEISMAVTTGTSIPPVPCSANAVLVEIGGPVGPVGPGTVEGGPVGPGTVEAGPVGPGTVDTGPVGPGTVEAGPVGPGTVESNPSTGFFVDPGTVAGSGSSTLPPPGAAK